MNCPLCTQVGCASFEPSGQYFHCPQCDLRFLDVSLRLAPDEEYARYLTHRNNVEDPGYRASVKPLYDAILSHSRPGDCGLDYGCGNASALAAMLEEESYRIDRYDPYFLPNPEPLHKTYDFIAACEVAEHFFSPAAEFDKLRRLLKPGGFIAVMTLFYKPTIDFANWHYRRDPTHVAFYTPKTFEWIAQACGFAKAVSDEVRVTVLSL